MRMIVPSAEAPIRLDRFLLDRLPNLPRGAMFAAVRKRKVRVNGKAISDPSYRLAGDDEIVLPDSVIETNTKRVKPDVSVLYEDDDVFAVEKPKGLSVHASDTGARRGEITLIDVLVQYGAQRGFTPVLVHRLDKYTTGVLIVAKRPDVATALEGIFRRKLPEEIRKRYAAIAIGPAKKRDEIRDQIEGKTALTRYERLRSIPWMNTRLNLLDVEIVTGRTHQIRRHLAGRGIPVAGDDSYGDWELNAAFRKTFRYREYALHCRSIELRHPVSGTMCTFESPIPEEMENIFRRLG